MKKKKTKNILVRGMMVISAASCCIGFLLGSTLNSLINKPKVIENKDKEIIYLEVPYIYYSEETKERVQLQAYYDYMNYFTEDNAEIWWGGYQVMMSNMEDQPESLSECFTEEEIQYLYQCVETEVYNGDFLSKAHVAMVIFNRLYDEKQAWGKSLIEVITKPNQFAYGRTIISEDTKQACEFAFVMGDMVDGAIAFHSGEQTDTFWGKGYLFTDECGHHFYK